MRPRDLSLFNTSSPTITLFSDHVDRSRQPLSLLASAVAHFGVIGVVAYGILNAPPPVHVVTERYDVRRLDMLLPEEIQAKRVQHDAAQRVANAAVSALAPHPAAMLRVLHSTVGPQTLIQPDLPVQLPNSEKIPIPQIQIWTPPKVVLKNIVAPKPVPPSTAEARPSLERPSPAVNLADVNIAESNLPTQKLSLMPSTTSPVTMKVVSAVQSAPSKTHQQVAEPTPTAVISVSDLVAKNGPVFLPPMNQTVRLSTKPSPGAATGNEPNGEGDPSQSGKGTGSGQGAAEHEIAGNRGQGNSSGSDSADGTMRGTTTKIVLAPTGHFGAVIVGARVEDQFPEAASIWSGRVAYTVYLHVGLARSWIMSYSLPRTTEAAAAGNANRLDAPWPYSIIRPNLDPEEANTDVLMIHGFVNDRGHFENLSVAYPSNFQQTPFVLKSLEQWQFRPGAQNGKTTRMEVLLIIPEEYP